MYRYLKELKNRAFLLILGKSSLVLVAYLYKETVLFLSVSPILQKTPNFYFISTSVVDLLSAYISLTYLASTTLVLFLVIYNLIVFISPALFKSEYVKFKSIVKKIIVFWSLGCLVFYKFAFTGVWFFFLNLQKFTVYQPLPIHLEAKISDYIDLVLFFYLICLIVTQVLAAIFWLLDVTKNKKVFIKKFRKLLYLVFILISTLLTPPEVSSQISLFLFLLVVFECLVLISLAKLSLIR